MVTFTPYIIRCYNCMSSSEKPSIVFIGAGNIATSLAISLYNADCRILQIFSRAIGTAQTLAKKVNAKAINSISNIDNSADYYFICVPDRVIKGVTDELENINGIVVHTSGSTDISILSKFSKYGVFYPFQTFSKNRIIPLNDVTICLSANNNDVYQSINSIASLMTNRVLQMDTSTRSWLHLSGVISNNFTNHLLALSYQISKEKGFDFELLKPLVLETVQKAFEGNPSNAQTGPAIRFDQTTINLHLEKLKEYSPQLADLYKALTLSIQSLAKNSD